MPRGKAIGNKNGYGTVVKLSRSRRKKIIYFSSKRDWLHFKGDWLQFGNFIKKFSDI